MYIYPSIVIWDGGYFSPLLSFSIYLMKNIIPKEKVNIRNIFNYSQEENKGKKFKKNTKDNINQNKASFLENENSEKLK